MMQNKHKSEYRYFLKLKREEEILYKQKWALPYIEVTPFQSGWLCGVKIKPQYLTHNGLKEAIELGYRTKVIYTVKDVKNIRKGIETIGVGKNSINYYPEMKVIRPKEFEKFNNIVKKYFIERQPDNLSKTNYYTICVSRRWLILKVRPNIFTRVQQIDPNIESRLKEIDEIMWQNMYWIKFGKRNNPRCYNINIRQDFKRQLHKFNLELDDDINNKNFKLRWI